MDRVKVKNYGSTNLYLYDFALKLLYNSYNKKLIEAIDEIKWIDSIKRFDLFSDKMNKIEMLSTSGAVTIKRAFSENSLYGYAHEIMNYGNVDPEEIFYFPIVEHGIPYDETMAKGIYSFNNSFIFQGKYSKKQFETESRRNAYYIGPYILYARPYYDEKEFEETKQRLGKTGLIFLRHSADGEKYLDNIYCMIDQCTKQYRGSFDSFLVCVYCQDALEIRDTIGLDGKIHLVSAGFKLDANFVRRLRTIIELSDVVFYDGFSSSIGYAYYLNKEIIFIDDNSNIDIIKKTGGKELERKIDFLRKAFGKYREYDEKCIQEFIEFYWGDNKLKTREEINGIFVKNKKDIMRRCGF